MLAKFMEIFNRSKDNKTTTLMGLAALTLALLNLYFPDTGFDKLAGVAVAGGLIAAKDAK